MSVNSPGNIGSGSIWQRWEPHIHAPGTLKEDRYGADGFDAFLTELENASPPLVAIGLTDYGVTASYERVLKAKSEGRLQGCELLFPNIELRLDHGTVKGNFINVHLLVSPEDPEHVYKLNRFLSRIEFTAHGDTFVCTPNDLMKLGREDGNSSLNDRAALERGYTQFKVTLRQMLDVYRDMDWARENILIAVSGAADGTSGLKDAADATLREEIEKASHIIFSGNPKDRDFWLGRSPTMDANAICDRYGSLKPCLWGSDAHELAKVGKPDLNRFCWIKGRATFDALRQACIDPERADVGVEPYTGAGPSQTISEINVTGAQGWMLTPHVPLNPGLVAIIGARGSGKTALADMIAAGCDAYTGSQVRPSFLARANEHMGAAEVALKWEDEPKPEVRSLASPISLSANAHPRARYLSQQFVEALCSPEGMPKLVKEIERVIFDSHSVLDQDGALNFEELLELRAGTIRQLRLQEEEALANISEQIGTEMEKKREIEPLKVKIAAKEKVLEGYRRDREKLLPKTANADATRLQQLTESAEKVQAHIRSLAARQASLTTVTGEVKDFRQNRAPEALRQMQSRHTMSGLSTDDWKPFRLGFSGDVDTTLSEKTGSVTKLIAAWKGTTPTAPMDDGTFVGTTVELDKLPLATLHAEITRLGGIVIANQEKANKLAALNKRIVEETADLDRLRLQLSDCEGAQTRAIQLVQDRNSGYERVFQAVLDEEAVLRDLYAPLTRRLAKSGGTLGKLSFSVSRVADVAGWADRGEADLFDLRTGPFRGFGSLEKTATSELRPAWETGSAKDVSDAMAEFQRKYSEALLERANTKRDNPQYRPWSKRMAQWLYSSDHISIEYGLRYNGIEVDKLSPGTRGIVLILLYLALDDADDRPLIIDQPEENLDPKSIYSELVPLFKQAKKTRQIIMVTHNANLVVNADADQVIIATVGVPGSASGLPPMSYIGGGLEEAEIRQQAIDILEGGEGAFRERARRLRIVLRR